MINFSKIPFVRILLPFVVGILSALYFELNGVSFFILFAVLFLSSFLIFKKIQLRIYVVLALLALDIVLFLVALELTKSQQLINSKQFFANKITIDHSKPLLFIAKINDIPVTKPNTIKVDLQIVSVKSDSGYVNVEGNLIAYFRKNSHDVNLKPGALVLVKSYLNEISEPLNPHAFNFKRYLADKNTYHTTFIDSGAYALLPHTATFSIWQTGLDIKYSIIERLANVGLSPNAQAISSALLTGFDDDIDKEVLEAFSHSGTLHILSVSGLHVGLIFLVLNYMVSLVDRNKKYKFSQFIFITVCLWFFALITGFSAPVLRSVIMFNLFGIGEIFFRNKQANRVNILLVSAFILLVYNPLWIRDIGFLLSYSALFGIIYFSPKLYSIYEPQSKIIKEIWKSVVVSFSATIATLPITLFVFHQFPLWFALANLVIVPLSFALLLVSLVALLKIGIISWLVNFITAVMVNFISLFNISSWSFIDHIDFDLFDAIGLTMILFFATALMVKRSYVYALGLLTALILWQISALGSSYSAKSKNELVVYQTNNASCVSLKNGTGTVLDHLDSLHYAMSIKPNITAYNNTSIHILPFNYMKSESIHLLRLNKKGEVPEVTKGVTHMLISNDSSPRIDLLEKTKPKVLIADGSNSYWMIRELERLCERMQIQFHSTRDKGAFILPL